MTRGNHLADVTAAVGLEPAVYRRGEVEAHVGLPHDDMVRWWRAMGFAEVPEDEIAFGDDDVRMATSLAALLASGSVAERDVLRLTRVLGASFSRIAEAQVSLLGDSVEVSLHEQLDIEPADGSGVATTELLAMLEEAIVYVWRRHLVAALGRRLRLEDELAAIEAPPDGSGIDPDHEEPDDGSGDPDPHGVRATTIGFVDIVGFSKLSKQLGADELADLVDAFEASALEVSATKGARIVKFIGDAAMYVAEDLATGVRVGLELQARARSGDFPVELHCGVAHGPAVTMGGDVFGQTVNLASRLTDVARRNSVAVPRDCAPELAEHDDLSVRNVRRTYDLKGIGRTRISVVSLAEPPEPEVPDAEQSGPTEVEVVVEFPDDDLGDDGPDGDGPDGDGPDGDGPDGDGPADDRPADDRPADDAEPSSNGGERRSRRERHRRARSAD